MAASISLVEYAAQSEDVMRKGLIQKITNESIFMRLLRFVPVDGFFYEYAEQTTLGGIAFRGLNIDYTPDVGVVNPKQENLSIFGGEVKVDRQIANRGGGVARVNAVLAKTRAAALFYDRYVIDGDPAVIPKSFYGLNARLTGNQVIVPAADSGNGGALALSDVDRLIDLVAGPNEKKIMVMNKADRRKLKQLAVAAAGGALVMDVGRSLTTYDGVTIEVLDEDGDQTPILGKDETRGTSNVTSSMYCIRPGEDPQGEWVQGLIGTGAAQQAAQPPNLPYGSTVTTPSYIEHVPQGIVGTSIIDLVELLGGLGVFHGRAASRLCGIL